MSVTAHRAGCPHGVRSGYCWQCGHTIRPTVEQLDWNHYQQAPAGHNCDRCQRCRDRLAEQRAAGRATPAPAARRTAADMQDEREGWSSPAGEYQASDNALRTIPLPGLGPTPGDRYRNRAIDVIGTVVAVEQRRYCWVTLRWNNREEELRLDEFERYWRAL